MREISHRDAPLRRHLKAFARELSEIDHADVDSVHRARVASRRLRELVPLLEFDRETARSLKRRLRKVTRHLGSVRELDALGLVIGELRQNRRYSPAALNQLGAAVADASAAARERLAVKLPTAKLERLAASLARASKRVGTEVANSGVRNVGPSSRVWLWAQDARLARRSDRLRSAIEVAGVLYAPDHLHAVRIAAKKLRYAAELSKEERSQPADADIAVLKDTQDLLGRLRDLEVLLARAREELAASAPLDLIARHGFGSLVRAVEVDCRLLHARYLRHRVDLISIANRMRGSHVDTPGRGRAVAV